MVREVGFRIRVEESGDNDGDGARGRRNSVFIIGVVVINGVRSRSPRIKHFKKIASSAHAPEVIVLVNLAVDLLIRWYNLDLKYKAEA